MEKILFLLPPSEGKNIYNKFSKQDLSFYFEKPLNISKNATQKDLKCSWARFQQWLDLNKNIQKQETIQSINRYTWVMYNAINYNNMSLAWKQFFDNNFLILSWMYWILKPQDKIWNYKLPIETRQLYDFWWTKILEKINELKPKYIVNLLPISYCKLILWPTKKQEIIFNKKRKFKIININFLNKNLKKISHWVKKIKWEWINHICENLVSDYKNFSWKIIDKWDIIDINIVAD